jgi:molybdopterin synthase sulfur carrier subunit
MAHKIYLSGHLKTFSNGLTEIGVNDDCDTVADILACLWREHLSLRDRILTEQGQIRQHVNIFYMGEDVRRQQGLKTSVDPGSELHIFNAVSGG